MAKAHSIHNMNTMDLLREVSNQKRAEFAQAASVAAKRVKGAASAVNDSIHDKPWYYMGGAAVVGFLAGIFSRRHRSGDE